MKNFLIILCCSLILTYSAFAKPLTKTQKSKLEGQPTLRAQMDKMVISIADLDILVNRDKLADYDIFIEDAQRILNAITDIRKIDEAKAYEPFLQDLETPTFKLLKYSIKRDKRAMKYTEKIFNACFRCHQENRSY